MWRDPRWNGHEQFGFAGPERTASSFDALISLMDWSQVAVLHDPLYPAAKSESAWPPLAMYKALLLLIRYDLFNVKLTEALDNRASFRRFCGLSANEATLERTAFGTLCILRMMSPRSPSSRKVGSSRSLNSQMN